jgi:hypothetical protein
LHAIARFLSIVLHPLLMPTYTLWLALHVDPRLGYFLGDQGMLVLLGMVALMTVAFPLTSTLLLLRAGLISSLEMPDRSERIAPYVMSLLYYGMTWYLLSRTPLHPAAVLLIPGALIALLLTTLITLRWKISAHMVGIGGGIGALAALWYLHRCPVLEPLSILLVLAGALGSARLITSDHTPAQVYAGAALGFVSVFATLLLRPALPF